MIVYADTSALIKLLLDEPGSEEMRSAQRSASATVTVLLAYAELRTALAGAARASRLTSDELDSTLRELEQLWGELELVAIDEPLVRRAGELGQRFGLRGYDAVHLAALSSLRSHSDMVFACWDKELTKAAVELGFRVLP